MSEKSDLTSASELPPHGKRLLILFLEFAKITSIVIGGGYVILTAVEKVFVAKRKWLTPEEYLDMVAIAQTLPGLIACNAAIYLGWRAARFRGAFVALLGTIIPPMVIIMICANIMELIPVDNSYVRGAFLGVNSCVVGLIAVTALKLSKSALKGVFEIIIAVAIIIGMVVFNCNPAYLMLSAIPVGIIYVAIKRRKIKEISR